MTLYRRQRQMQIPLPTGIKGSFESEIDPAYIENYLVRQEEPTAKVPYSLYSRPALKKAVTLPTGKKARHIWTVGSDLYVIAGQDIYKVQQGSNQPIIVSEGELLTGFVQTAVIGEHTIILIDSNMWLLEADSLSKYTEEISGYEPSSSVIAIKGFGVVSIKNSNLLVPTTDAYNPRSFNFGSISSTNERVDDLVAMESFRNSVVMFGDQSIEVWLLKSSFGQNDTLPITPTFPNIITEVGLLHKRAVARSIQGLAFIGKDKRVYHFNGSTFNDVSTIKITDMLKDVDTSSLYCFSFEYRNRYFYAFSWAEKTLVLDIAIGSWSVFSKNDSQSWGVTSCTIWESESYLVKEDNAVYTLSKDLHTDEGEQFIKNQFVTPVVSNSDRIISMTDTRLDIAFSDGKEDENYYISLEFSSDGGYTWKGLGRKPIGFRGLRAGSMSIGMVPAAKDISIRFTYEQDTSMSIVGLYSKVINHG